MAHYRHQQMHKIMLDVFMQITHEKIDPCRLLCYTADYKISGRIT